MGDSERTTVVACLEPPPPRAPFFIVAVRRIGFAAALMFVSVLYRLHLWNRCGKCYRSIARVRR